MRRIITRGIAAVGAVALLTMGTACSNEREGSTGTGSADAKGFAKDSLVGVALPSKTSENWVLAGDLFTDGLKAAGFKVDVQYAGASTTVADQQSQISAMVTKGAKVIVVGATDASQLATQVAQAKQAGAAVIAYDRLITNTRDVDYYIAFDNFKVGQLQGQALVDGMKAKKAQGPWTIELFSGSPDDNNSKVFFDGALSVLKPLIDKGDIVVGSDQKDIKQTAIQGWKAENAQQRMDSLLTSTYNGGKELDGVLSPNDTLARAILTSVKGAGEAGPGRHRSGLRGRVGEVDHGWRAVLHHQQGHAQARRRDDQHGHSPAEGRPAADQRHQVVRQRLQGRPGLPPPAGHRDQAERGRGLRQRPQAVPAHQVTHHPATSRPGSAPGRDDPAGHADRRETTRSTPATR